MPCISYEKEFGGGCLASRRHELTVKGLLLSRVLLDVIIVYFDVEDVFVVVIFG